jgi:hypothetical protein
MFKYRIGLAAVTLAALVSQRTLSASEPSAAQLAQMLAPIVDEQTLLVVHVSLANLEPAQALDQLAMLIKLSQRDQRAMASEGERWIRLARDLRQTGARDLFLVLSINDLPKTEFLMAVPIAAGVDQAAVEKLLTVEPHYGEVGISGRQVGELLVFARPLAQRNLQALRPVSRPEFAAAFTAVEKSTLQVLLLPSADTRRVIEEILPTLPAEIGGGASRVLARGITWAALAVDLPPKKLDARLVIQAASADAATELKSELAQILQSLAKLPAMQQMLPQFNELAREFQPTVAGDQLILEQASMTALAKLLTPPVEAGRIQAARARSMNNLKQIMLGMFNYLDADKVKSAFPPRALYSKEGKPLLSWRVQLLPYLDAKALYDEFHLDEPWDSEHNRKLIDRMPEVYRSPLSELGAGRTTYVVPILEKGIFGGRDTLKLKEMTDGTSNTIAVVEADENHAVIWTKPDDIEIDLNDPQKGLVTPALHGFLTAFADGSANHIPEKINKKNLGRLFMATDGEPIERWW